MYCINCGNKVDDNAYVCVNCGIILHNRSNTKINRNSSNLSGVIGIVFGVFSFILSFMCFFVDNKCNRVGLGLALASAFLIISEFFVIGIY